MKANIINPYTKCARVPSYQRVDNISPVPLCSHPTAVSELSHRNPAGTSRRIPEACTVRACHGDLRPRATPSVGSDGCEAALESGAHGGDIPLPTGLAATELSSAARRWHRTSLDRCGLLAGVGTLRKPSAAMCVSLSSNSKFCQRREIARSEGTKHGQRKKPCPCESFLSSY